MPRLPHPGKDEGQWGQILNDYLSVTHQSDGNLKPNIITEEHLSQPIKDQLEVIAGQQGATGPAGPQGATGASGTPGTPGAPGLAGATGASGTPGSAGATGAPGAQGATGATGVTGATGTPGQGVPTGGTAGQVLAKNSGTNFDAGWVTMEGGGGGAITIANLPAGSVLYARYNTSTSAWPSRPTARPDIMVHWVGADESTPPGGALSGVDVWDWIGS